MNRHEEEACDHFLNTNHVVEIIQPIKSGKEASVFLCRGSEYHDNRLLCLKIYKDFNERSFKRNESYQEGRFDAMKRREKLAVKKKSAVGMQIMESCWLSAEMAALSRLYQSGMRVPKPIEASSTAILMDYIGDHDQIASQLKDEKMDSEKALYLFKKIIKNIQQMFNLDIVHGDLSAYNILVWHDQPVIIDFPQHIDPCNHSQAFDILYRDVTNICNFFEKKGIQADSWKIAEQIWEGQEVTAL